MDEYKAKPGQGCASKDGCNGKRCGAHTAWIVACWEAFNRYLEAHT